MNKIPIEIEVGRCNNCPFSQLEWGEKYDDPSVAACYAPVEVHEGNYDIDKYYENGESPEWCPLKKQNLLITFKIKKLLK